MATIITPGEYNFRENRGRIAHFRLMTDLSREEKGIEPKTLNFDVRRLDPGEFSSPYHFHRYAEEMFVVLSGAATLRTPDGLHPVEQGDIIFFAGGPAGAHQLHNDTPEPCIYLDIRTFAGYDVCEYPDSDKLLIVPSMETFKKDSSVGYFDGEEDIQRRWSELEK
ncbi:MAG: cupin domain-containing protein [Alistipes sp.]|nr:cupin domain-containing protein [Alistipes sp.]